VEISEELIPLSHKISLQNFILFDAGEHKKNFEFIFALSTLLSDIIRVNGGRTKISIHKSNKYSYL